MDIILAIALFVMAAGYAAIGLGGGTGYLALLSFWSHDPALLRPLSWGLNVLAAGIGFTNFYRSGHFNWQLSAPLILSGIIGGAIGARLPIGSESFSKILAATLVVVAIKMFYGATHPETVPATRRVSWLSLFPIGLIIGVFSGLVGMGGGVILGPIILLLHYADIKHAAATTSLYVALSSAGALAAHFAGGGTIDWIRLAGFGAVCLAGGYLGSVYGARKASPRLLESIFALVVLAAGVRLALL